MEYSTYYLSSAGNELLSVATYEMQKDYFVDFAIEIKKKYDQKLKISLHVITALNDEECEYMKTDLIEER